MMIDKAMYFTQILPLEEDGADSAQYTEEDAHIRPKLSVVKRSKKLLPIRNTCWLPVRHFMKCMAKQK